MTPFDLVKEYLTEKGIKYIEEPGSPWSEEHNYGDVDLTEFGPLQTCPWIEIDNDHVFCGSLIHKTHVQDLTCDLKDPDSLKKIGDWIKSIQANERNRKD